MSAPYYSSASVPCICATLRCASRAVTNFYDLVLAPTGLRITQFLVLKTLHERGEMAQCEYARDQGIATETLSRRFTALRKKGLLEVRPGRRGERFYHVTPKGEQAYIEALPYWERAQGRLTRLLGDKGAQTISEMCQHLCQAAHEAEQMRAKNHVEHPEHQEFAAD